MEVQTAGHSSAFLDPLPSTGFPASLITGSQKLQKDLPQTTFSVSSLRPWGCRKFQKEKGALTILEASVTTPGGAKPPRSQLPLGTRRPSFPTSAECSVKISRYSSTEMHVSLNHSFLAWASLIWTASEGKLLDSGGSHSLGKDRQVRWNCLSLSSKLWSNSLCSWNPWQPVIFPGRVHFPPIQMHTNISILRWGRKAHFLTWRILTYLIDPLPSSWELCCRAAWL